MVKKTTVITIVVQSICWSVIGWLIFKNSPTPANAFLQVPTPQPFLGPIYYGSNPGTAVPAIIPLVHPVLVAWASTMTYHKKQFVHVRSRRFIAVKRR
ncbi:MAG: hypothetical protein HS099_04615 [Ardenticatenaceae bacterium]|nr:hypothetical protein [Ardenticatenaceae bacterium]